MQQGEEKEFSAKAAAQRMARGSSWLKPQPAARNLCLCHSDMQSRLLGIVASQACSEVQPARQHCVLQRGLVSHHTA